MHLRPEVAELAARYPRVRCGLDIGFADGAFSSSLRDLRGGTWMTVEMDGPSVERVQSALPSGTVWAVGKDVALPFEDEQFEVVVLNGFSISSGLVREIHRVLKLSGALFFTVAEDATGEHGYTAPLLYKLFLRNGFDVTALRRPPWWLFGRRGRTLTVCAQKKAWRK